MPKMKPIRIGVLGLGRAGWNIHVARMRGHPEFQIAAVTDLEPARLDEARREFQCETYTDSNSLLRHADVECVVVATQSHTHAPLSIAALRSGRHVIVEKPMAMNTRESARMIEAARRARRKLFVHQNYRYHPEIQHVLKVIREKTVGEVFEIRIRTLGFARRNDWQTLRKYGGGLLNNNGPHFLDAALQMLGSPVERLFSDLQLISDAGDAEDHVKLVFRGKNGRVVDMELSTSCALPEPNWTVLGSCGTLASDGKTSRVRRFNPRKVKKLKVVETPPAGRRYGNDDKLPWEEFEMPSSHLCGHDFYDNVYAVLRKGGKQEILPEQVHEVIRIIEWARKDTGFENLPPSRRAY
ncbi:MAG: Gfo/Idh/MocA family oxidoreductase [Planctomycetes bacterium]|nr:Gfo/Idh/MocA family oxidoreductase [Planctomycetota bacterium]